MVVLVAFLVGGSIWWLFFRDEHSSADCAPVRELLSYNNAEVDALNAKTHVPEEGSYESATEPSDMDYRAWSDGMSDRASKVTAEGLADQARELAKTVDRLVGAKIDYNAKNATTAPGAGGPQALAMVVTAFNDEYEARVGQLSQACPA
ncbi:hypothetical protein GCM10023114_23610 [Mycolicibacterium sediminis]|uniref:Uncharacterized protein n=1 Tax=Mycolicibacterium sediminis TaxID=1286180 RepID=A0A7I7QJF3_9MYCO|nr:hypothetical protein MSEDJ_04900 [Mycolicibacterium sediminis]